MRIVYILLVILPIIIKATLPVHLSFFDKITNSAERINHKLIDNDLNRENFNYRHHHHHHHHHHDYQQHDHHFHHHHHDHHQHNLGDDNHGTDDTTITTTTTTTATNLLSLIDVRAGNPSNSRI